MNEATIIENGSRPAVRLERQLADPPATVWEAITEREQLRSWFPSDVEVAGGDWKVGARIRFEFPSEVIDVTLTGEVLEVDEPSVLSFTWGEEVLRIELTPSAGGTLLVLTDELWPNIAARNAAGWDTCLDRLAGLNPDNDIWRPRFEVYVTRFEPELGPQEGPPTGHRGDQ